MRPTESTRAMPVVLVALLALLFLARGRNRMVGEGASARGLRPRAVARARGGVPGIGDAPPADPLRLHRRVVRRPASASSATSSPAATRPRRSRPCSCPRACSIASARRATIRPIVDTLQRRYEIVGFPTLLAVTPEGKEVGRIVGFPGRIATMDSLRVFFRRAAQARMTQAPSFAPVDDAPRSAPSLQGRPSIGRRRIP